MSEELKPLTGRWHHGANYICCGTLRVFRKDFDTSPTLEFETDVMKWVCDRLNGSPTEKQKAARIAELEEYQRQVQSLTSMERETVRECMGLMRSYQSGGEDVRDLLDMIKDWIAADAVLDDGEYEGADGLEDVVRWQKARIAELEARFSAPQEFPKYSEPTDQILMERDTLRERVKELEVELMEQRNIGDGIAAVLTGEACAATSMKRYADDLANPEDRAAVLAKFENQNGLDYAELQSAAKEMADALEHIESISEPMDLYESCWSKLDEALAKYRALQ